MNDGMQREMNLIDELLKYATLEVGEKLLSQQTDSVFAEITENISKDGVKVADYLTSLGLTQEEYKAQHVRATALKRLQGEIILSELKKKENIEISDEDMK
jgi:FKBP-type peptidyl-prolyl cis-trans isomerase (trigger factor)